MKIIKTLLIMLQKCLSIRTANSLCNTSSSKFSYFVSLLVSVHACAKHYPLFLYAYSRCPSITPHPSSHLFIPFHLAARLPMNVHHSSKRSTMPPLRPPEVPRGPSKTVTLGLRYVQSAVGYVSGDAGKAGLTQGSTKQPGRVPL